MAGINDESVENLITNLSNLPVPQLLKWMIVHIPIVDLNKCLRSIVDINLSGQSSGVRSGPNNIVQESPQMPDSPFPSLPSDSPPGGGEGAFVAVTPPSNHAQMVYDVIKASENTSKIPLTVIPTHISYYHINTMKQVTGENEVETLQNYNNKDTKKVRTRKLNAENIYDTISKIKTKTFEWAPQTVVPFVIGNAVENGFASVFNYLGKCGWKVDKNSDVKDVEFAQAIMGLSLLNPNQLIALDENIKKDCPDEIIKQEFGSIQRKAAKHNIYLTGYRFGDSKFFTYIFDEKNKKWLQNRKNKPTGTWESMGSLQKLIDKKMKSKQRVSKKGIENFLNFGNVVMPTKQFDYDNDIQLNPVPLSSFGYTKNFPVNRAGWSIICFTCWTKRLF